MTMPKTVINGNVVFVGGEDLTDEVKLITQRAEYTGTYSFIFKGMCRGEDVAIKVLKLVSYKSDTMKRKFRREIAVWTHVNHPNISPFYGYTNGSDLFGPIGSLISPWYSNGDASRFLHERRDELSVEDRIELWRGVVCGVDYLHKQDPQIVHGDLKPSNILIDESGNPRICDFGLAYIYMNEGHTELTTTSPYTGTERYLAPELLDDDVYPSTASDVWALGCIGLQFLYSITPYQHRLSNRTGQIFQDIRQGVPPASQPNHASAELNSCWEILAGCWYPVPEERVDAETIMLLLGVFHEQTLVDRLVEDIGRTYLGTETGVADDTNATPPDSGAIGVSSHQNLLQRTVPEYLNLGHPTPSNLILNTDGSVQAGTLPALVEKLTTHTIGDQTFDHTFLTTFKSFATINQIFDMLVARYNVQPPASLNPSQLIDWSEKNKNTIQIRSVNIMCRLIKGIEEEDMSILDRAWTFANEIRSKDPDAARAVLSIVLQIEQNGIETRPDPRIASHFPAPSILPRKLGRLKLIDIDPLELAYQLTIMESELFLKIKPRECIARLEKLVPAELDNIETIVSATKKIMDWVVDVVLSGDNPKQRAAIIKHFIRVAECCRRLANYSSMASLVTGLSSAPIRRLDRTWKQLSARSVSILSDLERTLDARHNFEAYKSLILSLQPPCVPFLGVYLTELALVKDSEEDTPGGEHLIDFQKLRKATEVIQEISRFQAMSYNLTKLPTIRAFIDEGLAATLAPRPDVKRSSLVI